MRFLKEASGHVLTALTVFVLFFLTFEDRVVVPSVLVPAGRLHPVVLHFPIVLLLLACVFEFFRRHLPLSEAAANWLTRLLLLGGALTAGLAVVFGLLLSKEDGYTGSGLEWHKWSGAAVFFCAGFLSFFYLKIPRLLRLLLLGITALLVLIAGHLGASITHGEGFITEPIFRQDATSPDLSNAIVYADLVMPVLKDKCFSCHNPDKAKGGLIMTDTASIRKGGESGQLIARGKPDESLLLERLLLDPEHEHRMPPKGKPQLTGAEVDLIRAWIAGGGDFRAGIDQMTNGSEIRRIASRIYGSGDASRYAFDAADPDLVRSLTNSYRLVMPVAFASPALNVSFFGVQAFDEKSIDELSSVAGQIVSLNLGGMPVTDSEMPKIASFIQIEQLNLNQTLVTDTGIKELAKLKNLTTLQIAGTRISAAAIAPLLTLPKLKRIYAWNTGIAPDDLGALLQKSPEVKIEIGNTGPDSTQLQLNKVSILPENSFFRAPFHLDFRHPIHGTAILYTLDGTEPDSANATIFTQPIRIEHNTLVKARPVKAGWLSGDVVEKRYQRSSIAPDETNLVNLPHPRHKGMGAATLFDLEEGSPDILYASDGKWLGYQEQDLIVEMTFTAPVSIREVTVSTLASVGLLAFPPASITISTTDSEGKSRELAVITPPAANKDSKISHNRIVCTLKPGAPVQNLILRARPLAKMPAWHAQAGKPAWLFVDEILLN